MVARPVSESRAEKLRCSTPGQTNNNGIYQMRNKRITEHVTTRNGHKLCNFLRTRIELFGSPPGHGRQGGGEDLYQDNGHGNGDRLLRKISQAALLYFLESSGWFMGPIYTIIIAIICCCTPVPCQQRIRDDPILRIAGWHDRQGLEPLMKTLNSPENKNRNESDSHPIIS